MISTIDVGRKESSLKTQMEDKSLACKTLHKGHNVHWRCEVS